MTASETGARAPAAEEIEHGTYGGYQKCVGRLEGSCAPCREAARKYVQQYRDQNPDAREKDRFRNRTRHHALEQLAGEYPARFLEILDELRGEGG